MKLLVSILIVLICLQNGLYADKNVNLEKAELHQGTLFSIGTMLTLDDKGNVKSAILGAAQKIMTERFGHDMPYLFPAGTELEFKEPIDVFGEPQKNMDIPNNIRIRKDMKIHGVLFPADSGFMIFGGSMSSGGKPSYFAELQMLYVYKAFQIKTQKIEEGNLMLEIKKNGKFRLQQKDGKWLEL